MRKRPQYFLHILMEHLLLLALRVASLSFLGLGFSVLFQRNRGLELTRQATPQPDSLPPQRKVPAPFNKERLMPPVSYACTLNRRPSGHQTLPTDANKGGSKKRGTAVPQDDGARSDSRPCSRASAGGSMSRSGCQRPYSRAPRIMTGSTNNGRAASQ